MNEELRTHIIDYLGKGTRYDGRGPTDYRDIQVETGVVKTAEGSARVKIGETVVIAGVKFELGAPYPDIPEEGTMMVNIELLPMSSPEFEAGPPSEQAVEIARIVDRGIRESKTIDTKSLCLKKGELVWTVIIDICPLNEAGNMIDASGIAAVMALMDAKFPEREETKINYKKLTKTKLHLSIVPIPVTVYKIGTHFIIDPLDEEEEVADARLTVTSAEDGTICALQKGGNYPLTAEDIVKMIDLALEKAKEIRKLIR
jgi:exosome complex component RRP42